MAVISSSFAAYFFVSYISLFIRPQKPSIGPFQYTLQLVTYFCLIPAFTILWRKSLLVY